jgi:hypothetical protein
VQSWKNTIFSIPPEERKRINALKFYNLTPTEKFDALIQLIEVSRLVRETRIDALKNKENKI